MCKPFKRVLVCQKVRGQLIGWTQLILHLIKIDIGDPVVVIEERVRLDIDQC